MFSALAATCSIDDAILLMELDVCSAAAARSSALPRTPSIERVISSIAAAIWTTDVDNDCVSLDTLETDAAISRVVPATLVIDRLVCSTDAPVWATADAIVADVTVICSMLAAISLIDDANS